MNNTHKLVLVGAVALIVGALIGCFVCPMKTNDPSMTAMDHSMRSMTTNLEGKTGDAFDQAFIDDMIVHHQGAVDMAGLVLKNSERPELRQLANDIIVAQTKEIGMMQGWRAVWFQNAHATNFEECAAQGNPIMESYPRQCRSKEGSLFVEDVKTVPPTQTGTCVIGGCSSQLCVEDTGEPLVSTCEFRAEYACYKGATCERQQSGACGWTETAELSACLRNPPPLE